MVSAVVRMAPLPADRLRPASDAAFETVVARAFSQRRKMLRRVLDDWAALTPWDELGIAPTARAEEVGVAQFIGLAGRLAGGRRAGAGPSLNGARRAGAARP
ncbi:dimethyladenosine transferase [Bordetella pertussis]|nr:dimethyladenosine transferase [Bordetella pertussis]